ncbi:MULTISPECIES: hypothetical protein [Helicobacter]|uniref:Uncharacterized protein n=1 Tax=Helicobacter ibis TaxID=2962633 RepID=A0ABT4VCW8_9HELI|nr:MULTISPECIES: hypothetical protein [Helicobacter]MDA3966680.1 hypothetical protein [Helicobacter sp. WB40]MDA3968552.1 hypothetical protein [Helicobacter ibis]
MNVNDKNNSMVSLLSQSYNKQNSNTNDISGYQPKDSNSIFGAQKSSETSNISSLFDAGSMYLPSSVEDKFEVSGELAKLQHFSSSFDDDLKDLGQAMYDNGILNAEEKMGFDIILKNNPTLDAGVTQNLLKNPNLTQESFNLLSGVDKKISAVRYFGGF